MQVHNLSGTRGPLRLQPWHRFCSLKKNFFFFKFTSCVSFVRAQETKLFAGECTLKPGKHCLVAFEKPHGEKSSSKYPYWWWGTVFILILAFTENTGTHTHTHPQSAVAPFLPLLGFWAPSASEWDSQQLKTVAGLESALPRRQKEGAGRTIVAFPPVLFLNLNNICTWGEGCEKGINQGSKAEPKKWGVEKKKKRPKDRVELWFGEGLHPRFQKHIFQFHKPQPPWRKLVAKFSAC